MMQAPLKPTVAPRRSREEHDALVAAIQQHPCFHRLASARARLGLSLAAVMVVLYFAYILTVALRPAALGTPVAAAFTSTWGVVAGVGLLSMGFVLTAIYVVVANWHLDDLTKSLMEDVQ